MAQHCPTCGHVIRTPKISSGIQCQKLGDKWLWIKTSGESFLASFPHDEAKYRRIVAGLQSRITTRLCKPMPKDTSYVTPEGDHHDRP